MENDGQHNFPSDVDSINWLLINAWLLSSAALCIAVLTSVLLVCVRVIFIIPIASSR